MGATNGWFYNLNSPIYSLPLIFTCLLSALLLDLRWINFDSPGPSDFNSSLNSNNLFTAWYGYEFAGIFVLSVRAKHKDMWMTFHPTWKKCPLSRFAAESQFSGQHKSKCFLGKPSKATAPATPFRCSSHFSNQGQLCPFTAPGFPGLIGSLITVVVLPSSGSLK